MRRTTFLIAAVVLVCGILGDAQDKVSAIKRAVWMQEARFGVMNHYLADWISDTNHLDMNVEEWNRLVDHFDVEALANQLQSVGARYYIISIGQNSGYYVAPNATYDRFVGIKPSKCSRRDLVADISDALHKRGIKLMVYLPSGAPDRDAVAVAALGWKRGPYPNREFQLKWEQVIREWSLRWGKKIDGWWLDGCYYANTMYRSTEAPNFASLAAAARAGSPDSAVAFAPGPTFPIISISPYEDYTAGEVLDPTRLQLKRVQDGTIDGTQLQMLSHLGEKWGKGAPRYSTEQVLNFSRTIWEARGAVTWDVPLQLNGTMPQPFIEQLAALGKAANSK